MILWRIRAVGLSPLSVLLAVVWWWAPTVTAQREPERTTVISGTVAYGYRQEVRDALVRLVRLGGDKVGTEVGRTIPRNSGRFSLETTSVGRHRLIVSGKNRLPSEIGLDLTPERAEVDVGVVHLDIDCSAPGVYCDDFGLGESIPPQKRDR